MKELWIDIKGYENYYKVSNQGHVKSLGRKILRVDNKTFNLKGKAIKFTGDGGGYLQASLNKNGTCKQVKLHHLVWDHFGIGKRNGVKLQVDHIDENILNNNINNLQLLTNRENVSKGHLKYNRSSKYTGVSYCNTNKKWRSSIYVGSRQITLGYFTDEYGAHIKYQEKLSEINNK